MSRYRPTIIALALAACTAVTAGERLEPADGWSPEAPPGRNMAGYIELHNPGEQAITLVDAGSPDFERVEIHTMEQRDGVMRMRRIRRVTIAPGETLTLAPGATHLMLFRPRARLAAGDGIEIELRDERGAAHHVHLRVRERRP